MSVRSLRYNSLMLGQAKYRSASTDRDAAAFLEAAGIYKSDERKAIYELVRLLKQYGLWSKMKAIYPFVGGTATTHKWNLKDPRDLDAAFRLQFFGGWTHSTTGAKPNGTNTYADTFFVPSTNLTTNSNSLAYYSGSTVLETAGDPVNMGAFLDGNSCLLILCKTSPSVSSTYRANAAVLQFFGGVQNGLYSVSRQSATVTDGYRNGIEVVTGNSGGTLPTVRVYIGNTTLTTNTPYASGYVQNDFRFASIGDGLTDTEAANLYSAVDKYQRLLSRNV